MVAAGAQCSRGRLPRFHFGSIPVPVLRRQRENPDPFGSSRLACCSFSGAVYDAYRRGSATGSETGQQVISAGRVEHYSAAASTEIPKNDFRQWAQLDSLVRAMRRERAQ